MKNIKKKTQIVVRGFFQRQIWLISSHELPVARHSCHEHAQHASPRFGLPCILAWSSPALARLALLWLVWIANTGVYQVSSHACGVTVTDHRPGRKATVDSQLCQHAFFLQGTQQFCLHSLREQTASVCSVEFPDCTVVCCAHVCCFVTRIVQIFVLP